MKTFIVLIPVSNSVTNPRQVCESIENMNFEIQYAFQVNPDRVLEKIIQELKLDSRHHILVLSISEFMDEFNNDTIDMNKYFMSYVSVTNTIH